MSKFTKFLYYLCAFVVVYIILQAYYFLRVHSIRIIDWRTCTEAKQTTSDGYIINCLKYKEK